MIVDSSPKLSGEPTAEALSNGLATLGRYGDNYMVHAAEGEAIIPKEILDANPGLKNDLFRQMTLMGVTDPNRYIVGSDLNSINPITGQPEFFFKKIFGVIKKIAKKILPIAAPIIGNMIAPGIGGVVASGLLAKMQGGTWGDAAKSAALGYGIGAIGRGLQGGFSAGTGGFGTGFTEGLGRGLTDPISAAGKLFSSGATNPLAQGIFGPRGPGGGFAFQGLPADFSAQGMGGGPGWQDKLFPAYQTEADFNALAAPTLPANTPKPSGQGQNYSDMANPQNPGGLQQASTASQTPSWRTAVFDNPAAATAGGVPPDTKLVYVDGGVSVAADATFVAPEPAVEPTWLEGAIGKKGAALASQAAVPLGIAGLVYAMSPTEKGVADQLAQLDEGNPRRTAYDQWQNLPDKNSEEASRLKAIWYGQPAYSGTQLASSFGANPLAGITPGTPGAPGIVATAAAGGEIFGPGTGTSDSIPARLSDGEFVMTAEAVRNAGGGDRALGAARMYDMMNQFERGAA